MDVTWSSYHRRQEILRVVVARAQTGQVYRPWHGVPGASVEFESDAEVLQELYHWWMRVLVTREVYDEAAAAHPGLRAVLDAYVGHPALRHAQWRTCAAEPVSL